MKYFWIVVNLLLLQCPLSAQPPASAIEVSFGEELNLGNDDKIPEIFGHDENGYFAHTYDYRDGVELLDTEFRSVKREYLDLMNGVRNRTLVALLHFHDTIYMFTSEERIRRMLLHVETIDKITMLQNGDDRLVMEVQNLSGWGAEFRFQLSRQETKLLVYSRLDVLSRKIQDLHLRMYGKGLSVVWEADQRISYPRRPPRQSTIKVNEQGDAFIISLRDDQNLGSLWNTSKNRYHLVAITENGQFNNSYLLEFPKKYIRGVKIEPGTEYDLAVAGFYSPTHFREMIDGIFYMELDNETGVFRNTRFHEFEPWFLTEAISPDPKKPPEEMYYFDVRHLVRRNNGNFIFIGENEFDQDFDTYQNIIVASISPGGTLNWKRVIPKRQGIDRVDFLNYSSFGIHAPWFMDKVYIVFNDNPKNGEWPTENKIKSFYPAGTANLKAIGIGSSGEISSSIIYRKHRKRMKTPLPLQYYDKLNHEMVIPLIRYKKYQYLKFGFNE